MMKKSRSILFFMLFMAVLLVYFGCGSKSAGDKKASSAAYEWKTIDEYYIPLDFVEEYIKKDSEEKGLLPIQIINYGSDKNVLRKFRGTNFASPSEAEIKMMYSGLGEWKLIDLKYKTDDDREVARTILYVYVNGDWMVGDSGKLMD